MSEEQYYIGGLPASVFVGRRVKLKQGRNGPHKPRATLVALHRDRATVKPDGHRCAVTVPIENVFPWWSMNPDLTPPTKAEAASLRVPEQPKEIELVLPVESIDLKIEVTKDEPGWVDRVFPTETIEIEEEQAPETPVEPKQEPIMIPVKTEKKAAPPVVKPVRILEHRRMIIGTKVASNWMELYTKYTTCLEDREGIAELLAEANRCCDAALDELSKAGVTLEDEQEAAPKGKYIPPSRRKATKKKALPKTTDKAAPKLYAATRRAFEFWFSAHGIGSLQTYSISRQRVLDETKLSSGAMDRGLPIFLNEKGYDLRPEPQPLGCGGGFHRLVFHITKREN